MSRIDQAVVWITGASQGIGRAIAEEFAGRGAQVALSARNRDALVATKQALPNPDTHLNVPLDVTDPDAVAAAYAQIHAHYGRIDILINNAGVTQRSLTVDTELDVYRKLMDVNFFGTVAPTRAVLPDMLARKQGHIVAISSVAGKFGPPLRSGYAAAKHAVHGFMDALRAETADSGVRVTVVCPGFINTEISKHALVGDGSAYGKLDAGQASGLAPAYCARRVAAAVAGNKDEIYVARKELAAVYLKRFAPGFLNRVLRNANVT